ncbi:uncharacterized protein LOC118186709 [Stegodyphus dumicola]|uniref:uncharacterized protein LOC118186709 n=1 Tax=Stegodyphus dumicola TaxID=202533 RepID=UPI0015B27F6F|nr:uncharacterized protein LOC118186709 [Stegodyphus dumicola]
MGGSRHHGHENYSPREVYMPRLRMEYIQITGPEMIVAAGILFCFVALFRGVSTSEQIDHRDFQYNSLVDSRTGRYNFAYDTGNDNDIAHSLHMEYRDANGIVRGRYGYTDPRGKLRVVEYEAGPDGFKARGDVGPDLFPHDEAPELSNSSPTLGSLIQSPGDDLQLVPAPIQMAGWDPFANPMGKVSGDSGTFYPDSVSGVSYFSRENGADNITNNEQETNDGREVESYVDGYPVVSFTSSDISDGKEVQSLDLQKPENEIQSEQNRGSVPLNIYNIDVSPDEIRVASGPVRRSADGNTGRTDSRLSNYQQMENRYQPYRVKAIYVPRQTHDHDAEIRYARRQTHDHDAETRYPRPRTHDHDTEVRYARRQTHDHDAERRYPRRQTHDHDAETRYPQRQTHDHAAEWRRYYGQIHDHSKHSPPRRIFYRDSHSMEPHEHYNNPVYQNYRDHQHSDVHLYGRSQNYASYHVTAKPRQLKYIPADKYHDKYYYWIYD